MKVRRAALTSAGLILGFVAGFEQSAICAPAFPLGAESAFTAYADLLREPLNPKKAAAFLASVDSNRAALAASPGGSTLLVRAGRARAAATLGKKFDQCFGSSAPEHEGVDRILRSISVGDGSNCRFGAAELSSLNGLLDQIDPILKVAQKSMQALKLSVARGIFADTAARAARIEVRWRKLLPAALDGPNLREDVCAVGCPASVTAQMQAAERAEAEQLAGSGGVARSAEQAAADLRGIRLRMDRQLYGPDQANSLSRAHDPASEDAWRLVAEQMKRLSRGGRHSDEAERYLLSIGPSATGGLVPSEVAYDQTREAPFEDAVLKKIPPDFFAQQAAMNAEPIADLLIHGDFGWQQALGAQVDPKVKLSLGRWRLHLDAPQAAVARPIEATSIAEARDAQISLLHRTLGELASQLFRSDPSEAAPEDLIKKLLLANPAAAGESLMAQPQLFQAYCDAFKGIAADASRAKWTQWALVGATVGAAVATVGGSLLPEAAGGAAAGIAAASGATLATVTAAGLVTSIAAGGDAVELARLQQTACVARSGDSKSCADYEKSVEAATSAYLSSGLAAAGLPAFARALGSVAKGSVLQLVRAAASSRTLLRDVGGTPFAAAFSAEEAGGLFGRLSRLTEEQSSRLGANIRKMTAEQQRAFAKQVRTMAEGRTCSAT